jgi:GGDEF domain-containing protein
VLALSERAQREMLRTNAELLAAQEGLRRLVDRDPLTALANRRSLPEVFRAVQPKGATLLFFDLDGFQAHQRPARGHQVGDECLKRFAAGPARELSDPRDAVIRYAGDEFLVVRERARQGRDRGAGGAAARAAELRRGPTGSASRSGSRSSLPAASPRRRSRRPTTRCTRRSRRAPERAECRRAV